MKFNFENLDLDTRQLMSEEIKFDVANELLYYSKRFNENGLKIYLSLLLDAVSNGDEESLAIALKINNCFLDKEARNGKNGVSYAKVPETANVTLAESEFNRFYIRALALRAISSGQKLAVYRARESNNPRAESERIIGSQIDANQILQDLRRNVGLDTVLGLPPGPNSGLSIKLV